MSLSLSSIHIYPIKGAAGINPKSWDIGPFGFQFDRRWMIVEPDGEFLTQRELPELALIRPRVESPHLVVEAPRMPALKLALHPMGGRPLNVRIWDDRVDALLPDQRADEWFSEYLGIPVRLAWMPDTWFRQVDRTYADEGERTGFADGFPFLAISEASLDDLNTRLADPVPMNRFRPNLVIRGATPFAEDEWHRVTIGQMEMRFVKPCARCVIPNTDQLTAERGVEPLKTLATFRRVENKVMFGQNVLHGGPGRLSVGDPVTVLEMATGPGLIPREELARE